MTPQRILVIVPAFNEAGNIGRTVAEIRQRQPYVDILAVDDGSTDQTRDEAESANAEIISLPFNLGIGGAVQTGFIYAVENDYDIALQVDGDGQHDPSFIPALVDPLVRGETDIALGSRFIGPYTGYRSSFVRRIGIHFFAWLISSLTGYAVTDSTSGFRAFNKKAIRVFAECYPTDFPEPESIVIAKRYGLRLKEIPVEMRKRLAGHSSIRYLRTLQYMIKVTLAILLNQLKAKKGMTP